VGCVERSATPYSGKFIKERPKVARDFLQAYAKGVRYGLRI
jgi:ABC-type nitrate/sulfonate/bicarbonate transport system substrate-binding protein